MIYHHTVFFLTEFWWWKGPEGLPPLPSLLWCCDFRGSLAHSWVFCTSQLWSSGKSTVLYSCFFKTLLPLTISNSKSWKILSIWWKPGLNVRHFAAFKNRRCLSRKQFFLDDSGLSLCASLMYHIILRLTFQVFIFFPSVSVVTYLRSLRLSLTTSHSLWVVSHLLWIRKLSFWGFYSIFLWNQKQEVAGWDLKNESVTSWQPLLELASIVVCSMVLWS